MTEIYSGSYSTVYVDGSIATKTIVRKEGDYIPIEFLIEVSILMSLNHKNIMKLMSVNIDKYSIRMLRGECTLTELMKSNEEVNKDSILRQIASGLLYLESRDVLHGDIKSDNIIIYRNADNSLVPVIADFGIYYRPKRDGFVGSVGSVGWKSPEELQDEEKGYFTVSWSFGLLICFIYNLNKEVISNEHSSLIQGCLVRDPSRRMTMKEICEYFGESVEYKIDDRVEEIRLSSLHEKLKIICKSYSYFLLLDCERIVKLLENVKEEVTDCIVFAASVIVGNLDLYDLLKNEDCPYTIEEIIEGQKIILRDCKYNILPRTNYIIDDNERIRYNMKLLNY